MSNDKITKRIAEKIIRSGWPLISEFFNQATLQEELKKRGYVLGKPNINNIHSKYIKTLDNPNLEPRAVGAKSLILFATGLLVLIKDYKQEVFDFNSQSFVPLDVDNEVALDPSFSPFSLKLRTYEEGRRTILDKIQFIKDAKHEVVEMGIRLNTFSKYFLGRRDSEFKDHIIQLLARGVELKCLMMDPAEEITKMYFEDRAKVAERELKAFQEMPLILDDLVSIKRELDALDVPGKMRIFLYKNFPYYHYLTVDGNDDWGKMMYSSYIYGEKRANCPVTEIYHYGSPELYKRHWKSICLILDQAKEVISTHS